MKPREEVTEGESRQICRVSRAESISLFSSLFAYITLTHEAQFEFECQSFKKFFVCFSQGTGASQCTGESIATGYTPSTSTRLCTGHVPSRRSLIPKHRWKHQHSSWFETLRWVTHTKSYHTLLLPPWSSSFQDKDISSYWVLWKFGLDFERMPFASPSHVEGDWSAFIRDSHIFRPGVAREHSVLESHWADRWLVLHQSAPGVTRGTVLAEGVEEGLAWSSRDR